MSHFMYRSQKCQVTQMLHFWRRTNVTVAQISCCTFDSRTKDPAPGKDDITVTRITAYYLMVNVITGKKIIYACSKIFRAHIGRESGDVSCVKDIWIHWVVLVTQGASPSTKKISRLG